MLGVIFSPFVIAVLSFILYRYCRFVSNAGISHYREYILISVVALIVCPFCLAVGFFIPNGFVKRVLISIGNYWLGFCGYFMIVLIIFIVVRSVLHLILKDKYDVNRAKLFTVMFVPLLTLCIGLYGIINAHQIKINSYSVSIDKSSSFDELNIVLVADLHIGYSNGLKQMTDMVNKINDLNPDVVIVAGDIFDNDYGAIKNPKEIASVLRGINSEHGTYYVLGNHDVSEKIFCGFTFENDNAILDDNMSDFLKDTGWTFLYDEKIMIDNICIYGRPDEEKINLGNTNRFSIEKIEEDFSEDNINIVIDHEPKELTTYQKSDLVLSGHTHNGQLWPINHLMKLIWDNPYGYKKIGNVHSIVTSGVGLFGPNMRVGTNAEIVSVRVLLK